MSAVARSLGTPGLEALVALAASRFGIQALRPGQGELLSAALAGEDTLGILPTGGGKSLAYQLPALVFDKPVVVVSPLIALMRDQCDGLTRAHVDPVELDSTLGPASARRRESEFRGGAHPILYLTPERLRTAACIAMLKARGASLLAIDEAHCVSEWGHDFRPSYLGIARAREALGGPPMIALTATATEETARDIVASLGMRTPRIVRTSLQRENLSFVVEQTQSEMAKRLALMKIVFDEPGAIIVYAATVKAVDELYRWMRALDARLGVARYHGKMHPNEREESRARFMDGAARVIVATKAFGMGIDKRDVRAVVHYQLPDSIESYMQEAGRAGRDGARAVAWLLYRRADARVWRFLHRKNHIGETQVRAVVDAVARLAPGSAVAIGSRKLERLAWELARVGFVTEDAGTFRRAAAGDELSPESVTARIVRRTREWEEREEERLEDVLAFAEATGTCRTVRLLAHFGERGAQPCGRCDACRGK